MFQLVPKQSPAAKDQSSQLGAVRANHGIGTCRGSLSQAVIGDLVVDVTKRNGPTNSLGKSRAGSHHDFGRHSFRPAHNLANAGATVSAPADRYEQEADRVAEQVMSLEQRGRSAWSGGDRRAADSGSSGGHLLPPETRQFFEPRFDHSFADIRVHSDRLASDAARDLGARAYTVGRHIFLGAGEYRPSTQEGRRLLAHELAHAVQQSPPPDRANLRTPAASLSRLSSRRIQRRLVATGDTAGFAALVNSIISVQLQLVVSGAGMVSLSSTNIQGPLTREASALVDVLRRIILDPTTTTIAFTHGATSADPVDQQVMIGSYGAARIDLDDVGHLGAGEGVSAASALAHELVEQYRRQVAAESYPVAHAAGMAEEELVTGARRGASTRRNINATTYEIEVAYHYPDRTVYVTRVVQNQNIVDVRRRTTRP